MDTILMAGPGGDPVYWDDAYPIALLLRTAHPGVDPSQADQATLRGWIVNLPGFADDPQAACGCWLNDIRSEWLEIGSIKTRL